MTMTDKISPVTPGVQRRSGSSIALALFSIGLCVSAELAILGSRYRFSQVIDEFGMTVSYFTRFTVGPVLPALLGFVTLVAILKELVPISRTNRDRCNIVVLLVGSILLATYTIGVFLPLMSLLESLS